MAYNTKKAQDSANATRQMDMARAHALDQAEHGAPSSTPSPATSAQRSERTAAAERAVEAGNRGEVAPPASAPPARSEGKQSFNRPPVTVPAAEPSNATLATPRGYAARVVSPHAPSRAGLTWHLERLIDEVAAYRGFSKDRVEGIKDEAAKRPEAATLAYQEVFTREVAPFKQNAVRSVQDAIKQHPDQTVYVVRRGQDIHYETRERGGAEDLLHGAVIESVSMRSTPFPTPAELFAEPSGGIPAADAPAAEVPAEPASAPASPAVLDPADLSAIDAVVGAESNPFSAPTPAAAPVSAPAAPEEGDAPTGGQRFARFRSRS